MNHLDLQHIRRAFGRAASSYAAHAVLQAEVESRLQEQLDFLKSPAKCALDIGCGIGRGAAVLRKRYPKAHVIALDLALPMLRAAKQRAGWWRPFTRLCGDAQILPIAENSVDLIYSNLCVQWCTDFSLVLDEFRRVLRPGGLLLFSTFGPDTLMELRAAFATVDNTPHVSRFLDMHIVGDALLASGFRDPVLDVEKFTLTYTDAMTLMRELRAIGATNADSERQRTLTGKAHLQRAMEAYEPFRKDGLLPASYEVVYAHAWGPEPGQPRRSSSGEIASFPIERLRGSQRVFSQT